MKKIKYYIIAITCCFLFACSNYNTTNNVDIPKNFNLTTNVEDKSYAIGYQTVVAHHQGVSMKYFPINAFTKGTIDKLQNNVLYSDSQISNSLTNLLDAKVYRYRTGILFISNLKENFNKLNPSCWSKIDQNSLIKGIYDGLNDMKNKKVKDIDSAYFKNNLDQFLTSCRVK